MTEFACLFTVLGRPAPQGSKTYLGRGRFKEQSNYVSAWRNDVRNAAMLAFNGTPLTGPILTSITFIFARPKCHYIGNNPERPLRNNAPFWHVSAPDKDKLERATNDALKGVVWGDDSQVAATLSQKIYSCEGMQPGAIIEIYSMFGNHLLNLGE